MIFITREAKQKYLKDELASATSASGSTIPATTDRA